MSGIKNQKGPEASLTPFRPVEPTFFRGSTESIARRLLGMLLLRRTAEGITGGIIVETEAYLADDPSSHAFRGPSARNQAMFGPPGRAYVYQTRHHFCVNVVTRPDGVGEAVLLRALEPTIGLEFMASRRKTDEPTRLARGPANLCAALAIDRGLDGATLLDAEGDLILAQVDGGNMDLVKRGPIIATPRIGISKAVEWPLRFLYRDSPFVSRGRAKKR